MAAVRETFTQRAQANIKKQLLEHPATAQFFRGMGDRIICADPGELLTTLAEKIAGLSLGIIIEVVGGPLPRWGEEQWDAEITIFENPVLNRAGNWDGKSADVVLDAVARCFADCGAFVPGRTEQLPGEERTGWIVHGKTTVAMIPNPNPGGQC